jgi:hypothetical protein
MGHRSILTTQQYISASTILDTTAADVMEGAHPQHHGAQPEPDVALFRRSDPGRSDDG